VSQESRLPLTVFKVGGSLFDLLDLPARLNHLFTPTSRKILLFGGGKNVDGLRHRAARKEISDEDAHWEAIRLMSASALMQSRRWSAGVIIHSLKELAASDAQLSIFDAAQDVHQDAGLSLPIGWEVTSDSIAAWLALKSRAKELVLLKSVGSDDAFTIEQAVARGWLDPYFPTLARELTNSHTRITWINARDPSLNRLSLRFSSPATDKDE